MVSFIKNKFLDMSLNKKILLITSLTSSILLSTVILVAVKLVLKTYNETLYKSIASQLRSSTNQIQYKLDTIESLSNVILADPTIQTNLAKLKYNSTYQLSVNRALYNTIQSYYSEYQNANVSHIELLGNNTLIKSESAMPQLPCQVRQAINTKAYHADGATTWITNYCQDYGLFVSRVICKIDDLRLDYLGILTINVDLNAMIDSILYDNYYNDACYLLYDQHQLIYQSSNLNPSIPYNLYDTLSDNYQLITLGNGHYFAVKGTLPQYKWDYVVLINYNRINNSIRLSYAIFVFIVVLFFIFNISIGNLLINSVLKHLNYLITRMKQFSSSKDLSLDSTYDYYNAHSDEISLLHQQFENMATEIQRLVNVNYVNKLLLKEAELKTLETQINPHFLYNTLDSINWRAKQIGEPQISLMVQSLGNLLRMTLSSKNTDYKLANELKLITAYLTIQQIRYEERLVYHIDIDEQLYDASIPKLTIQPIIENAIVHGLEEMIDTCIINIRATCTENILSIYISNNGPLFPEDLWKKIKAKQHSPQGLGIGLVNIDERIKLTFSTEYGLDLYNEDNLAVVKICIPYLH